MNYQYGPGPFTFENEQLKNDIGIVEKGDSATHAIADGQYVVWKDDLYIAKADISIGDTLSSSNLTTKTKGLGEEIFTFASDLEAFKDEGLGLLGTIPKNKSRKLTSTADAYYLMITYQAGLYYTGMWIVRLFKNTSSSTAILKNIIAPDSGVTVEASGPEVQISNTYASALNVSVMPIGGTLRSIVSLTEAVSI